jgi:hypothetical protein
MRKHNRPIVAGLGVAAFLVLAGVPRASSQALRTTSRPAQSQAAVSQADIERLQESVYDTEREVGRLKDRDAGLASTLQQRLDDVRDEVAYLRVKLRKQERVARSEVDGVRERLERVREQALADNPDEANRPSGTAGRTGTRPDDRDAAPSRTGREARANEIPVGTEMDVRLQRSLSSGTSQVEDTFQATTMVDLMGGDRVLVPAGSIVRGVVSSVDKAGRIDRKGRLTLAFDRMTVQSRSYPIRATVTEALESEGYRGDAAKIGAGAGVGAILGGILGGVKGALAGVLIGGGGVVAATEGQDVDLPAGTVLRIRFDEPLLVR